MTPASIIPVFGSQRPYADLNFAAGSFGLNGTSVSSLALLAGFTFTRASLAMGYDATGKLTYGPNNLLLQSQTLDNASWTKTLATVTADAGVAPDGTTTADKIVVNNGAAGGRVQQVVSATAGTQYLVSAYVKPSGWNWFALRVAEDTASAVYFDVGAGQIGSVESGWSSASITSAGDGWYRIAAVYTALVGSYTWRFLPTNANAAFTTGDDVNGIYLWGAQLEAVTYQTTPSTYYPTTSAAYYGPRLVYDPVTLASQGILVEEARTNLLLQSQTFDNASWQKNATTVTANSTTSPDGTANADTLLADAGTGTIPRVTDTATTLVTSTVYTASIYAKAGTYSFVQIYLNNQASEWANFTLSGAGTASANGSSTASITALSNGWYRLAMTYTAGGTDRRPVFMLAASGSATRAQTWNPAGTESVYLWQAQLEAGTGASSPIPTTTASVTRAADVAVMTGLSVPDGCTVVMEGRIPAFITTDARAGISTNDNANRIWFVYNGTTLSNNVTVAGPTVAVQATAIAANAAFKAATAVAGGAYRASLNGGTVGTGSGPATATMTQVDIGTGVGGGSFHWNNTISRIRIYNRALPDAQLQSLTT